MIPTEAHGTIALQPSACTSCMICVRECPTWCIDLDSHTEQVSEPGARRPKTVNILDAFRIDFGLCMYCGICVDLCPFDALAWSPQHDLAATTAAGLVLEIDELARAWPDRGSATGS